LYQSPKVFRVSLLSEITWHSDVSLGERRPNKSLSQLEYSSVANLNTQQGSDLCMVSVFDLNFLSLGVYLKPAKLNLAVYHHKYIADFQLKQI